MSHEGLCSYAQLDRNSSGKVGASTGQCRCNAASGFPGSQSKRPRKSYAEFCSLNTLTYKYFRPLIPNLYIPNIATTDFFTRGG
jgi:hypothetical protein